jgi:adenylate cyclase
MGKPWRQDKGRRRQGAAMAEAGAIPAARPFLSGVTLARLRLWSGLILFAFAALHLMNHALGLISVEAMEAAQHLRKAITRNPVGSTVLVTAALTHAGLGLWRFVRLKRWQIGVRGWVQLGFGLMIPLWLIRHVFDMRVASATFGFNDSYSYAIWAMWPYEARNQTVLVLLVWVHGCIGMHHWLSLRAWYRRTLGWWLGLAVLVPVLALAGFLAAARAQAGKAFPDPFQGQYGQIAAMIRDWERGYLWLLLAAVALWAGLMLAQRLRARVQVRYEGGRTVAAPRGQTLLDTSRAWRIPHASICGGRARCSTCRVRVTQGLEAQPAASETERRVLSRVGAPANVRLACQLRLAADLAVSPLLPATVTAAPGPGEDRYLWGVEQDVTLLFADLRGFTKLSEGRLPFDVVFLLNQFMSRMAEAIEDSGGYVDKFMGDGIMAIFGIEAPAREGARQAVAAARAMGGVLAALNQSLAGEVPAPLAMGIGLNTGPAILGRIGAAHPGGAGARLTALGETVNVASRLEALTKELGGQAVVAGATMAAAGLVPGPQLRAAAVPVRGISVPVAVWVAEAATDLPDPAAA